MKIKTFNDETPETSDVVLCAYCGSSLHNPEEDIEWSEETPKHVCKPMLKENYLEIQRIAYMAGYYQAECNLPCKFEQEKHNAQMAMAETASSWEARCHHIMNVLGIDYGGFDEAVSDEFLGSKLTLVTPYLKDMAERGDGEAKALLKMIGTKNG